MGSNEIEKRLFHSAWNGDFNEVDSILKLGNIHIDCRDRHGLTPLHWAAWNDKVEIVELLIKNDATVNSVSDFGFIPLHEACAHNHLEVVKILLEHGADPDYKNSYGKTPEDFARDKRYSNITNYISKVKFRSVLMEQMKKLEVKYQNEIIDLKGDLEKYKNEITELKNQNPNLIANSNSSIPFAVVVPQQSDNNNEKYTDDTQHNLNTDEAEKRLLDLAWNGGCDEMELILKQRSLNINCGDRHGLTPLHWAAWNGKVEIVKLLIKYEALVNSVSDFGFIPLHEACIHNRLEVVKILLEHGADPYYKNGYGKSPEDCARDKGYTNITNYISMVMNNSDLIEEMKQLEKTLQDKILVLKEEVHKCQDEIMALKINKSHNCNHSESNSDTSFTVSNSTGSNNSSDELILEKQDVVLAFKQYLFNDIQRRKRRHKSFTNVSGACNVQGIKYNDDALAISFLFDSSHKNILQTTIEFNDILQQMWMR